jgi:hypothetical protein
MRSDIERYKQQVARLDLTGVDFAAFRDDPLPVPVLRCLRYMHDVEHHTVCYLRDLLVTPAHRDPAVTTFLTLWSYEELWHGEAIARVLAAHDEAAGAQRIEPMRRRPGRRDRFSPIVHALGSSVAGESFPALHMAWGAVNEWTTQAGYARLASRASHPVLTDLLSRIMRQEGRHVAFYAGEAEQRLARSRRTQRFCRLALRHLWRPVGSGVMPPGEVAFLVGELFGDADGRAMVRRIDQRVDRLPGLSGLHLVERAVDRCPAGDTDPDDTDDGTGARRAAGAALHVPGGSAHRDIRSDPPELRSTTTTETGRADAA